MMRRILPTENESDDGRRVRAGVNIGALKAAPVISALLKRKFGSLARGPRTSYFIDCMYAIQRSDVSLCRDFRWTAHESREGKRSRWLAS